MSSDKCPTAPILPGKANQSGNQESRKLNQERRKGGNSQDYRLVSYVPAFLIHYLGFLIRSTSTSARKA